MLAAIVAFHPSRSAASGPCLGWHRRVLACNPSKSQFVDMKQSSRQFAFYGALSMRIVVFDEADDVASSYDTRRDTLALCPGRLEKAHVIEALQEAAFFINGRIRTVS
jgi:hypothetical protein